MLYHNYSVFDFNFHKNLNYLLYLHVHIDLDTVYVLTHFADMQPCETKKAQTTVGVYPRYVGHGDTCNKSYVVMSFQFFMNGSSKFILLIYSGPLFVQLQI